MTVPTPTPLPPFDTNATIIESPWSDYYMQTMNETLSGLSQDMLDMQVTIVVIMMFILGILMMDQFRRRR